jgi:hypothetical protein
MGFRQVCVKHSSLINDMQRMPWFDLKDELSSNVISIPKNLMLSSISFET